jgi:hypothetical protein
MDFNNPIRNDNNITNGSLGKDPVSNVTITKDVVPGCKGPQIIITIKAPDIKEIKRDIVISLDTSGSFGVGGRPEYGAVLREVMPEVLEHIEQNDPMCRISLVSWDDDIDFAYGPMISKDINKAELMPIDIARSDLVDKNLFDSPPHKLELPFLNWQLDLSNLNRYISLPFRHPTRGYNCTYLYFWENESTNLSLGVLSALNIMKKSSFYRYYDNRILLITGRSEFVPINKSELTYEIIKCKYPISVVGFGVPYDSDLNKTLYDIVSSSNGKNPYYTPGILGWTKDSMLNAIDSAVDDIMKSERIINNITINEVLYPYLKILSINVSKNKNPINYSKNIAYGINDNSTMLTLRWLDSLNSSEELQIVIDTELNMSLPIEVSTLKTRVLYNIDPATSPSFVTYYWQDRELWMVALPEERIM